MPVWNDKMAVHQAASRQVSVNPACTWSLLFCNAYQFCSSNVWVIQHRSVHSLDMSTIIVCVYLWLQFKWNQLSSNNSRHTSCIHKGLHALKWPDLMTSKPDTVITLGCHWTDYTGTKLADGMTHGSSSSNPVLTCIIGTHWKTTVATSTLGCHWNHIGWCQWCASSNSVLMCILRTHWLPYWCSYASFAKAP